MAKKYYGPYADKSKGGRKKMTVVDTETGKHSSTNAARYEKEKSLGRKLPKNQEVDHKDNNKHNDGASNLRVISKSKNVAKENKHRVGKAENSKNVKKSKKK